MTLNDLENRMTAGDATAIVSSIIALKNEKIVTIEEARDAIKKVPFFSDIIDLKCANCRNVEGGNNLNIK